MSEQTALDRHALAHVAYEALQRYVDRMPPPGSPYGDTVRVRHDLDDLHESAHDMWGDIGEAVARAAVAPWVAAMRTTVKMLADLRDRCDAMPEHRHWCSGAVHAEMRILEKRIEALLSEHGRG